MANPMELEDEDQHLNLGGCFRSKQAISILYLVVVKDTVSMVLEISYLQVVSLSVDLQSNVFIGAMADLIPQVLVWIPWTFSCKSISSRMLFHQGRIYLLHYDLHATVWSALSWPYQVHLRITALAVGS
ncbi:hypothetical protein O0I10_000811 [Lichtheimia ornata]|uniref:Uncharacterized protein n=1 Tax=Lichtheimia ornata TaxID=688661 RepID=A0AAD7Y4C5_9FUNG|nr:uncharacterized protein O0I10_000811 [Lichtheimia ornata]KAJ8663568.1 hypothetical protein O0I10_000811 [Lichtheimia ornata]